MSSKINISAIYLTNFIHVHVYNCTAFKKLTEITPLSLYSTDHVGVY